MYGQAARHLLSRGLDRGGLGLQLVDVADHVKGSFGKIVMLAREDVLENLDGILKRDKALVYHTRHQLQSTGNILV